MYKLTISSCRCISIQIQIFDVYRKDVKVQKNIFKLALYIALFPQLIAGPIVRYVDIEEQIEKRNHSFEKFAVAAMSYLYTFLSIKALQSASI